MSLILIAVAAAGQVAATPPPPSGDCGWLVLSGDALIAQPDPTLKPIDPRPLPKPPVQARAAYCIRVDPLTHLGDERLLKRGYPLIIRWGANEAVLELNPTVMFNYHKVGDRYLPGIDQSKHYEVIRAH